MPISINIVGDGDKRMADDKSSQNVNPHLIAVIVRSYVAKNSIAVDQLGGLIVTVHRTLSGPQHEYGSAHTRAAKIGAGGACPAIGPAGPCRVPRMRISGGNPAPTFAGRSWARTGGLSCPLETRNRLPADGTGLFRAPFDDGKTTRARPQADRG